MTDKERIDYLEKIHTKSGFTGQCTLRRSTTGRGWRLHESDPNYWEGCTTVRQAIDVFAAENPDG